MAMFMSIDPLSIGIENHINSKGDLVPVPGKASALFSISRYQAGYIKFFRHDLPVDIRHQINVLDPDTALNDHKVVCQILDGHIPCDGVFAGIGCYFDHLPSPDQYPDAVYQDGCYVILVDGEPVSWAWTANESEGAAELAVETKPEYRNRGYARQVVAAWANYVIGKGKVAFYSYEIINLASEALAKSLDVVQYAVVTTYESKATSR
jgi:GNAT superfamily N-acetyltransferase